MSIDQIITELGVRTVTKMVDFYKTAIARNDLYLSAENDKLEL